MEALLEAFVWRLTWWLVRLLWLPFLIIAVAQYFVLPAISTVVQIVLTPAGVLAGALVVLWLWRR